MQTVFSWIMVGLMGLRERRDSESGQDLIEYALLGGLIAAAVIAVVALGTMTNAVTAMGNGISACIDFKKSTPCGPF
jgi:Flp pilus assembly pilin Flp